MNRRSNTGSALPFLAFVLALVGIGLGAASLYLTLQNESGLLPGDGMEAYDFSTPEKSLESYMQIEVSRDLRAQLELELAASKEEREEMEDAIDTLDIKDIEEFEDYELVFHRYKKDGKRTYKVIAFKEIDGEYYKKYFSRFDLKKGDEDDVKLYEKIKDWEDKTEKGDD